MSTSVLLAGLIGALVATILAVFYQYVSLNSIRRFEVMLLAVDYFDEINFLTRQIEHYKAKKYTENCEIMTTEEYRSYCNKLNLLIASSKIHAAIALAYGKNSVTFDMFNQFRSKLTVATGRLFRATQDNWLKESVELQDAFAKDIDPLRQATEFELLRSAGFNAVLLDTVSLAGLRKSSVKNLRGQNT